MDKLNLAFECSVNLYGSKTELKRKDEFNEETAGEVFEFTKNKVKQNLTRDSKKALQYVYTNLDAYIESQIEKEVRKQGALNE